MFDFTKKKKEKYFRKAEKLLAAAGLTHIEIDREIFAVAKNETAKIYTKKFTKRQVPAKELKTLKNIDNFTIAWDRYSQERKGRERQIFEYGYFSFPLSKNDR